MAASTNTMNALYSIAEIRAIEQAAIAELPLSTLMQRAGQSAANCALGLLPDRKETAHVLVLAGPGNNGGDALELAAHLANAGVLVSILLYAQPEKQPEDARQALKRAHASPARFRDISSIATVIAFVNENSWALIIDGLFGIGLKKPISGELQTLVETVNALQRPLLALDAPSGLNADTGAIVGNNGTAIRASHTITFIGSKPGLFTRHGRDYAGQVTLAPLDIEARHYPPQHAWLNEIALFAASIKPRRHESHKGSYGNVAIIGGASGMAGAPILAARAALHSGAGRVYAVFLDNAPTYDSAQPELMLRDARHFDLASAVLVAGPGLGQSRAAHDWLAQALNTNNPIVLDADALNLIAAEPGLQQKTAKRKNATLLTPHPLEAARLLDTQTSDIQANRLQDRAPAGKTLQRQRHPERLRQRHRAGRWRNRHQPNRQSGSGQRRHRRRAGRHLRRACWRKAGRRTMRRLGATWLHGTAADDLVRQGIGPIGLAACETPARDSRRAEPPERQKCLK